MNKSKPQRRLLASIVGLGLLCGLALLVQLASGIERVSTGREQDVWRSLWLLEFNWPLALLLFVLTLSGILGGLWLGYRQWRQPD